MGKHLAIWCASVYRDSVLAIIARRGTNGSEYLKARNPSYNQTMAKNVIHISEAEAATTTVATLLVHVRAGAEVVIENDVRPVAVALCGATSRPSAVGIYRAGGSPRLYRD